MMMPRSTAGRMPPGYGRTAGRRAGYPMSIPHHRPDATVLRDGDLLKLDFGATVEGYHSDMTRTVVLGGAGSGHVAAWQREIYELAGKGLSNGEIAAHEYVSEATVKTHVSRILAKLGLRDRVQLVVHWHGG